MLQLLALMAQDYTCNADRRWDLIQGFEYSRYGGGNTV